MKNKVIVLIVLLLTMILSIDKIMIRAEEIEVMAPAKAMVVLEGNSGEILYSHNANNSLPMASTTKIVTAIVAIENCDDLDKKFVVSDKSIGIEGTSIYLKQGEMLSMRELLYGLILASGNDCAVAIAEYFGSEEGFVDMMNNLAQSLGCSNTHFDNPHGLDSDTHYTSAYDLAVMTAYALDNQTFRDIVATERMVIEPTEQYQARYLKHKNKLLFKYENCIGVKTGFTDNAGRCLVNAHEENGMQIISVVLNCQPMFEECERLTQLALDNYMMKTFVLPYNFVSNVHLQSSDKTEVGVITIEGFSKPILKSEEGLYRVKYNIPETIVAPVELNQEVGVVEVYYKDELIYSSNLITIEGADNNDLKFLIDNIIDQWF
ncbi:MAG: D-alanyl-D-alanine carboxypeptidase [Clostridia bacterium]|nr:D-alanyl-D-alanine carboxypeptidase [Clostridia bacterium]